MSVLPIFAHFTDHEMPTAVLIFLAGLTLGAWLVQFILTTRKPYEPALAPEGRPSLPCLKRINVRHIENRHSGRVQAGDPADRRPRLLLSPARSKSRRSDRW
jgi:hypothetical protein